MSDIQRLTLLAETRMNVARQLADTEQKAEAIKKQLDKLDTDDIPSLMAEVGMSAFTLEDGTSIDVAEDVKTSITKEKAPKAIAWLLANNFGGIVKTEVKLSLPKGNHQQAVEAYNTLSKLYPEEVVMSETVHPATLKSFVKERLEAGDEIPFDTFSIHPFNKIKVRLPK